MFNVLLVCLSAILAAQFPTHRTFTYSIAQRGAAHADMRAFADAVSTVYADRRGWSLGGRVTFRQVQSGGDFTVWLAAADEMRSFSAGCGVMWDCRVGRDVIINQTRWLDGSPYWHGPLADYRAMILNHETGHWLGLDHESCAAPRVRAPVMMEQSKGTGACIPNPWPLAAEKERVARILGFEDAR
jgi:hypothetical protein